MTVIPGVPEHLETVPPAPDSHLDEDAEDKRIEWRRWRYDFQVWRTKRRLDVLHNPDKWESELRLCASHPARYLAVWGRVFEPRWRIDPNLAIPDPDDDDPDAERMVGSKRLVIPHVPLITQRDLAASVAEEADGDPALMNVYGWMPFIPFADQVRVMNELLWTLTQTDEHADAIWSKCRGWGASWILCGLGVWGWRFSQYWPGAPPWNILYVSRKEEYVDSRQQKSLFWKVRRLIKDMPPFMLPKGYGPEHDQKLIIMNPENGNQLSGESTNTQVGRGDRQTVAIPDEAAAIPEFANKWATLTDTADHRWGASTESFLEGPDFWDMQHSDEVEFKPWLIQTNWWENPLNDDAWLVRQQKRFTNRPDLYNQEVWRKPYRGTTMVYPWMAEIRYDADIKPVSGYRSLVSMDPGYRDPTAILAVQQTPDLYYNVLDAYQINGKEADYFAPLLRPELFEEADPGWRNRTYMTWTSPLLDENGQATLVFEYDERALSFARTIADMGAPEYVGDSYGESMQGATKDSTYSRLRKLGIKIHGERKKGEQVTRIVQELRTHPGRKEAMNDLSQRWRFASTMGAKMAGNAWKNARYATAPEKGSMHEPTEPIHDSTSHLRTAGEFLASSEKRKRKSAGRPEYKTSKAYTAGYTGGLAHMGAQRGVGLNRLPHLTGISEGPRPLDG